MSQDLKRDARKLVTFKVYRNSLLTISIIKSQAHHKHKGTITSLTTHELAEMLKQEGYEIIKLTKAYIEVKLKNWMNVDFNVNEEGQKITKMIEDKIASEHIE